MINMTNAIKNTISISLFNRGLAGKIFEDVKITGAKVVMKNNVAECVLLSPDEYVRLMDEVNDARLLNLANEFVDSMYEEGGFYIEAGDKYDEAIGEYLNDPSMGLDFMIYPPSN